MITLKIKSKNYLLKDLIETIESAFKIKEIENKYYEININNKEGYDILVDHISLYLSSIKYSETIQKKLEKGIKDKKEVIKIVNLYNEMFVDSVHFIYITKILLLNYLKNNDEVNIDAFLNFNMSIMDDYLDDIAKMEIEDYKAGKRVSNNFKEIDENKKNNQDTIKSNNVIDKLIEIHDSLYEENLFKDIHVKFEDNDLVFENNKKEILTTEYIHDTLNVSLKIEGESENSSIGQEMFLLSVLTIVYNVQRVIIHEGIPENTQKTLEVNLNRLLDEGLIFKIYFAGGSKSLI